MSHEIDNNRAMYARTPAWHNLGIVKEEGWFSADEALTALGMDEEVHLLPIMVQAPDGHVGPQYVLSEDLFATVQWSREEEKYRIHGAGMTQDYGVVQARQAFRFLDEVVGAIDGAHYESVGNLRKGRQTFMLIDTGAIILDAGGRADRVQKYILGVNSYDRSLAFRVKFTNIRVECANLLACALRGSSDEVVDGDWSTKHTRDVLNRVEAAQRTLGLYKQYEDEFMAQAGRMIEAAMSSASFDRLLVRLFEEVANEKTGVRELGDIDREQIVNVRTTYELSPSQINLHGTFWGGLQAVTENYDWNSKVRGGRNSDIHESRFRKQLGDTGTKVKDIAWSMFYEEAKEYA